VQPGQLDALVAQAWEDSCHRTNPVPVTPEDLRVLYEEAL
jgi:alcohol dehydrogenase class IV